MSHAIIHPPHAQTAATAGALTAAQAKHKALVTQTEKWVAQSFFGTILKQMRKSPFKSEIFDGGRGGEVFHEMLDQRLADHMSKGAAPKLVDSIVQKIERGKASAQYLDQSLKSRSIPNQTQMSPDITEEARPHVASIG